MHTKMFVMEAVNSESTSNQYQMLHFDWLRRFMYIIIADVRSLKYESMLNFNKSYYDKKTLRDKVNNFDNKTCQYFA